MTEQQWLTCKDADELLAYLRGKSSNRKLRLFSCSCYRRIWDLIPEERHRMAVEMGEHYADKLITRKELERARMNAMDAPIRAAGSNHFFGQIELAVAETRARVGLIDAADASPLMERLDEWRRMQVIESKAQANMLHDLIGNPFRPVTVSQIWLTWNDATVIRLAQTAYDERILPHGTLDNSRLLILADALEEAGCTDEQILTHLRGGGEHYRGCWVVDLLLAKSKSRFLQQRFQLVRA